MICSLFSVWKCLAWISSLAIISRNQLWRSYYVNGICGAMALMAQRRVSNGVEMAAILWHRRNVINLSACLA
jgi:hypothetical protein